jgi:SulP family sulfate permease
MLTVAQHTFSWAALKDILKGHVPLVDVIIMVGVTLTTSFINMAAAVALGVLASALRFAWQASCNMSSRESGKGTKLQHRYIRIRGPLFFGSALVFQKLCEPSERDREVAAKFQARCALAAKKREEKEETFPFLATGRETIIDFSESQVWDHAAIMAIEAVCKEYHKLGVILRLRYLSPDCREKLLEGSDVNEWSTEVDVDIALDPSYLVGEDPKNKF